MMNSILLTFKKSSKAFSKLAPGIWPYTNFTPYRSAQLRLHNFEYELFQLKNVNKKTLLVQQKNIYLKYETTSHIKQVIIAVIQFNRQIQVFLKVKT
jgi:hypothetical protein